MAVNNRTITIIVVIIIVVIILWLIINNTKSTTVRLEGFDQNSTDQLDRYYTGGSLQNLQPYLIDQMQCSPSCCGRSWDIPFDGLNEQQVKAALAMNAASIDGGGNYVKNNYTCGIGAANVGCPCITPEKANFIGNRGGNTAGVNVVDPSFLIPGPLNNANDVVNEDNSELVGDFSDFAAPNGNLSTNGYYLPNGNSLINPRSSYSENRDLSHLNPGVNIQDLSNVQSYGPPLPMNTDFGHVRK